MKKLITILIMLPLLSISQTKYGEINGTKQDLEEVISILRDTQDWALSKETDEFVDYKSLDSLAIELEYVIALIKGYHVPEGVITLELVNSRLEALKMNYNQRFNTITKWTDVLTFGKYKDKTIKEIHDNDNSYLIWLIENTTKTSFPRDMIRIIYEYQYVK